MFYEVIAQFAKANAPSFRTPGFEEYLIEAKANFNIRSRVATNPKEITELSILDDRTIRIVFRSQEVLNISQISRSLRLFSMYLIDETHTLNFSNLVTGKRLFRMNASELFNQPRENIPVTYIEDTTEQLLTDEQALIEVTKLFFQETDENRRKINIIKQIIGGGINEI